MKLGDKVRSKVSGLTGIAVGHAVWLYGCERVLIQPPVDKDGKDVDCVWVDMGEAEVVERGAATGGIDWTVREDDEPVAAHAATGGMADPPSIKTIG